MGEMMGWLRRLDPGLRSVRRGARVTVVACIGFYTCRYALDDRIMATYALFGAVALGGLAQIPGRPAQRSRTLLAVLPVSWMLVTVGTLLAIHDWAAAAGMFVLGFAVSFAGVGGPRLVGLTTGLQLLYILPCFPPYDPGSLSVRLIGVTIAVVLLAIAEVLLWPDPTPPPYETVLATAVSTLADGLAAAAACLAVDPSDADYAHRRDRWAAVLPTAYDAAKALRPALLQPGQRPASASRRDHALSHAGSAVRYGGLRVNDLNAAYGPDQARAPAASALLDQTARTTRQCADWLGNEGQPPPTTDDISWALIRFRLARQETDPTGIHPDRLRVGSLVLTVGDSVKVLVNALRVAAGAPLAVDTSPAETFSFADRPAWELWWYRLRANFTPRSVYFQGALRLALALAVGRLLAGVFDLTHGFWVLLAILTLLRASAAQTRMASRPILAGTALGAVVAGGLLILIGQENVYAFALPLLMFFGFSLTPLVGQLWGQALFTLVIMFIFAQLAPANWRVAEARVIDVAIGVIVGVLIGLLAWPRGGTGELHRATGRFLSDCGQAIRETVGVLIGDGNQGGAVRRTRTDVSLAEASFSLYQSERGSVTAGRLDWQAAMIAGNHTVRGAETLLRSCPPGHLSACIRPLRTLSESVAVRYADVGGELLHHVPVAIPAATATDLAWPTDLGETLYHLADLRVWLEGVSDDLTRIQPA
jgi:uncharacterized membrane protein YccC